MKTSVLSLFVLSIVCCAHLVSAHAGDCVGVRNGQGGVGCMKFSAAERRAAAAFDLRIGESVEQVDQELGRHGWSLDRDWLRGELANAVFQPPGAQMICGDGLDALCTKAFKRGARRVYLTFSKNSDALIGVDTKSP